MIYLDNSATTFPDQKILDLYINTAIHINGNPSSQHALGYMASFQLEEARKKAANSLHVEPNEIIFTSSGSESNNAAIKGIALQHKDKGKHIITSSIEHASVFETCKQLETLGFSVTYLPVDQNGRVSIEDVEKAICEETILVSLMYVNSEIGSVQPIEEIGELLQLYPRIMFHVDAVQAFGKLPIYLKDWSIDLLSLSSHKFHSPRGAGLLFVREGVRLLPLIAGGGQENGLRSGTENVASIVAMGAAMEWQAKQQTEHETYLRQLKDYLLTELDHIPGCIINSSSRENNAPHILNFSLVGIESNQMIEKLESKGIIVSKSSACSSTKKKPSRVLREAGIPYHVARSAIRVSLSTHNTLEEIDQFLTALLQIIVENELGAC
ncbi:cysteine desulfurase [Fictibacillus sp. 23RED33]|uniref:cysteine desulfurase family protein n=1 Tax=Fictibacillus sp. 23RED33 TaxID=2745879 RepID=UPI0018CD616A|nr:cysteine desulfurase [Fictibacillus sp. 23RED33]